MKRNIWITAVLVVALVFGMAFDGYAQQPQIQRQRQMRMMDDCNDGQSPFWSAMNVTDEQKTQLAQLRLDQQRTMIEVGNEIKNNRTKLRLMTVSDDFSQRDADRIIDKITDLNKQQMKTKTAHVRAVRAILTPEQRVIFDQHVLSGRFGQPGKGPHPGMMGPRGGRGQGQGGRGAGQGCR
ncbi:MAG: Spy/CpxP family protein refolding chaperone [Candidatus Electryoneaceae bacterium]|nr:Spy/CpxP family protein refolding chaperone [Candidatus Electryoneaceae bacterium]